MLSSKLSVTLLCVMGLALAPVLPSHAQNSQQDYVNAHNTAQAQVNVGPMTWDNTVAAYAQNYANQRIGDCRLVHPQRGWIRLYSRGFYGENLAWSNGDLSGTVAVTLWVDEKANYNYDANTGAPDKYDKNPDKINPKLEQHTT
ncbi:pathogenesis-related protein 1-like [Pistacia vera]|uniref:pathogenesis-related protein 1-like n=1 Tax=Pistacia vera TaxID=55513 RepID=UPI00126325D8|nr:pathogenesis-related protein 1-like [Pistacia vera]